ncbi:MAG: helix-turn-helix domain-containing protein [Spirosomataceae bacterium]
MDLGEQVKTSRLKKGWTQQQVSEATGISLRTVQRIEKGEVNPSAYSLQKIGEALEVNLLENRSNETPSPTHYQIIIQLNDMNQFVADIKTFAIRHWKLLITLFLLYWALTHYTDIKAGILDAWNDR